MRLSVSRVRLGRVDRDGRRPLRWRSATGSPLPRRRRRLARRITNSDRDDCPQQTCSAGSISRGISAPRKCGAIVHPRHRQDCNGTSAHVILRHVSSSDYEAWSA